MIFIKKEIFKEFIYTFIKRNSDKIQYTYQELGFKNKNELLKSVKENLDDACWAFTELMRWGMDNNYRDLYQVGTFDDEYETQVFMIKDKLFTIESFNENNKLYYSLKEVVKIEKTIWTYEYK